MPNKKSHTFLSIHYRKLLDKAWGFASNYIEITIDESMIIKHTKSTLYSNNMPWRKIRSDFDVTMGSFDGTETCELVRLFLLSWLTHLDVKKLDLALRINTAAERESFITPKDHKDNFKNKLTCRLINPCKPEIGKISKHLLQKIVNVVKNKTNYNHWKNTHNITWFGDMPNKKSHTFLSIHYRKLLDKAWGFASNYIEITIDESMIIKHTKSTLYSNNMPWRKIRSDFDVTIGSFDGTETCELVGRFLLSWLTHLDVNVGLYANGGLTTCIKNAQGSRSNKKCAKFANKTACKSLLKLIEKW